MKSSQKTKPRYQTKFHSKTDKYMELVWCLWCGKKFKHFKGLRTYRCPKCWVGWYTTEGTGQFFYWPDAGIESRLSKPVPLGLLMVASWEEL